MNSIPSEWIKNHVDKLISVAKQLPENSVMQKSITLRAEAIMDMVAAYKDSLEGKSSDG